MGTRIAEEATNSQLKRACLQYLIKTIERLRIANNRTTL